jgi:mRNA interferase RelE/StbE
MRFALQLSKQFNKDLEELPEEIQKRVVKEVALVLENPFKQGVLKLAERQSFRTRIGDYRLIFNVNEVERVVTLIAVGYRSKIYER